MVGLTIPVYFVGWKETNKNGWVRPASEHRYCIIITPTNKWVKVTRNGATFWDDLPPDFFEVTAIDNYFTSNAITITASHPTCGRYTMSRADWEKLKVLVQADPNFLLNRTYSGKIKDALDDATGFFLKKV